MRKNEHLKSYTAEALKMMRERGEDLTDWEKVDAAAPDDEEDEATSLDWSKARLVMPNRSAISIQQ